MRALKPSYNQRLVGASFQGTGLKSTVYHLESNGKKVADLMVVTNDSDGAIDAKNGVEYKYSTTVCNPNLYAGNGKKRVENSVSLFSAQTLLNTNTASQEIQSDMLGKDTLTRANADIIKNAFDVGSVEAISAVNSAASNNEASFDYVDKSVIYRIHVNANGIVDVTNDVTTADGESLGNYKFQDVLPKGWEFQKINKNDDFLMYEGTGNGSKITASSLVSKAQAELLMDVTGPIKTGDDRAFESITFDFKKLDKPYVILVKAGPNTDTAKQYFSKIGESKVTNKVNVKDNSSITEDVKASSDVTIKSEVLLKTIEHIEEQQEYLKWQVDYRPYGVAYPDAFIEDELPIGLDLRLDSQGNLVIEDEYGINISIRELSLRPDGTYVEGQELALPNTDVLSYENETRKLKFTPSDTSKSYRIRYLTDITGEGGLTVNNEVVLNIGNRVTSDIGKNYTISSISYGALFKRSGWFEIAKTDGGTGAVIDGAKFALCSLDGVVIREGITNARGELFMKALPMGDFILKEIEAPSGYAKTDQVFKIHVEKDGQGLPQTSIDGDVESKLTMLNFKEGSVGDLAISKTVAGSGGDENEEFEFTVRLKDNAGNPLPDSYTCLKMDKEKRLLEKSSLADGQTVKLSHQQNVKILDIPKETVYEVIEKDYTKDAYVTTVTGDSKGKIAADTAKQVHFTNTRNVSGLTISKTVAGNGADTKRAFSFKVEFNATGNYSYAGTGGASKGTIKSGDTIELAHGQSIVIEDIPDGTSYKVQEQDYSGEGYTTVATGDKGSISGDKASVVSFINTKQKTEVLPPAEGKDPVLPEDGPQAQRKEGKDGVKTGDNTTMLFYAGLFILSASGMVSVVISRRRKKKSKN